MQMARPKGISSISCIKSSFQKRSTERAYVFKTALSGSSSRRIWWLSVDGRNRTHADIAEGALRHAHCRASRLPCRDASRGGYVSYPRAGRIGRTRASRKALCNIRAVTASEVFCRDVSRENSVPVQPRTFRVEVHHPPTEQFTYDARPSTRRRTANDESGSASCVRSRICRSDRPISVAVLPFAAQMARPKVYLRLVA